MKAIEIYAKVKAHIYREVFANGPTMNSSEWQRIAAETEPFGLKFLDQVSLLLAIDFNDRNISYTLADSLANDIWWAALADLRRDDSQQLGLLYEVYEAFDAGEYHRDSDPPNIDPVTKYTQPAIKELLDRYKSLADEIKRYSLNP